MKHMSYIILDRDGVINYNSSEYIKSPEEWIAIPGSLEAIACLNKQGFKVFIVTNQSGVARGYYDIATLDAIHEKMMGELASVGGYIEQIFFCPHHPDEKCYCRKPQPGLLHELAKKYPVNFEETFYIGDSLVDVQAALAVGCKPILVLTGNGEDTLQKNTHLTSIPRFADLATAIEFILENKI
jgi:D-glycero-D-manno-heptose 1,7-bisphosphate phosphatase